jgi:hypothetical protein
MAKYALISPTVGEGFAVFSIICKLEGVLPWEL